MIERWQRKVLRTIFGGENTADGWQRRTNQELRMLYKEPTITRYTKAQRIRWAGHVERMDRSRMPKKVLLRRLVGTRRRGRPRKRCHEKFPEDIGSMEITDWKEKAKNRIQWRNIVQQFLHSH
uniref:Uncharacterized protein LOC114339076 n=1 Tax=Diabrotica virgifera virgifera TaxID=50390 RepID=A0A6P7GJW6_DIAVI